MTALHDHPAYLEGHAPPVLTAEQIYADLRPRLLAWPEPVVQIDDMATTDNTLSTVIAGAVVVGILIMAWLS